MKISVIVPFYNGNKYLNNLIRSIERVATNSSWSFEIIIVNDSPWINVKLPDTQIETRVLINEENIGIQGTRINGIRNATGEWILMLDQDDELVAEGFEKQIELTKHADVVVGNGRYLLGNVNKKIYDNFKCMRYLIQRERFIKIRNLIPSPGECLIRKEIIPQVWMNNRLIKNGSDDWMLWLLLFSSNARFAYNDLLVYIHNDAGGANLSANLDKMRESSLEMVDILRKNNVLQEYELSRLEHSIHFKYCQDKKQLSVRHVIEFLDAVISNIIYRIKLNIYKGN